MCGRFSLAAVQEVLLDRFSLEYEGNIVPRYNISPAQDAAIITNKDSSHLTIARWGLIPHWAKDKPEIGYKTINAKAETLAEKPSYSSAFKVTRCLVPADGFYEWKKDFDSKVPYRFVMWDDSIFAFAGLWTEWEDSKGISVKSFTIITLPANGLVREVHDRMPAILLKKDEKAWLSELPAERLFNMLSPYPAELMRSYQVSTLVNNSRSDSSDMIKPVSSIHSKTILDY
jgi:putative SOS response-associated peptidase YedK